MPRTPALRASGNLILGRLPASAFDLIEPGLQRALFVRGQVIQQCDAEFTHVYFPTTALFSLLTVLEEDDPVEAATVGREGFVGVAAALGAETSPHRAICQVAGESLRLPMRPFLDAMARGTGLARSIHSYVAFTLRVASQGIACGALHSVEARASRRLLMIHDQVGTSEFPMTQELLASMLGVRRQSVTAVAGALRDAGVIRCRRGRIKILDRARLEEAACECYASLKRYYDRDPF